MHENSYLEECIRMIERNLDWGPSGLWTAYHFSKLSQEIYDKTNKTVSDSTLKRLFGKKDSGENYNPQLYTKNAIAEYLGFKDWQNLTLEIKQQPVVKKKKSNIVRISGYLLAFSLIVTAVLYFVPEKTDSAWLKTADTCRTVPFTAVFHYDVSKIEDSVFIDFGNNLQIPLPKEKHVITEFYKSCGVFYPRIITSKGTLDSLCMRNYSKGWQGGYSPNDDYLKFIPFEDSTIFWQNNRLYIPAEHLNFQDLLYNNGHYVEYRLMKNFKISLDSVNFKTIVKNSPAEGGKLCYDIEIWLIGSKNNCKVRFVEPECFRYGQFQISEKNYNGRFDDLSTLARDLKDWKNIGIKINNHIAEIRYNDKVILKETYKKNMGEFIGIYIRFYGTGSLQEVEVFNHDNHNIYKSNFKGLHIQ